MSKKRKFTRSSSAPRRITLREESLLENKALGLEEQQEQMDFIFRILKQYGINSQLWLEEYMLACEANGGQAPADLERFLPWNLSEKDRRRLSRETTVTYGNATFIQKPDGKYLVKPGGQQEKVDIGSLTWQEFQQLTRL